MPITIYPDRGGLGRGISKVDPSGNVQFPAAVNGPDNAPLVGRRRNRIAIAGNSIVNQCGLAANAGYTYWSASASIALSAKIVARYWDFSTTMLPRYYLCTKAGTSGATEPAWESASVGDTIIDGGAEYLVSSGNVWNAFVSFAPWISFAQQIMGQPFEETWIGGFSQKQSAEILSYYPRMTATNPDIVWFATIFENDLLGASPNTANILTSFATLMACVDDCLVRGRRVILQAVAPSAYTDASSAFTGYVAGQGTKVTRWLNEQLKRKARSSELITYIPFDGIYRDTNTANPLFPENTVTYVVKSGTGTKNTDGIHPQNCAAWNTAKRVASILSPLGTPEDMTVGDGDYLRAVKNPNYYGSSGTIIGTGTGSVPNNHTVYAPTGGSVAVSVIARSRSSKKWLQLTMTIGASAGSSMVACPGISLATFGLAVGDWIQVFCEAEMDGHASLRMPSVNIQFNGSDAAVKNGYTMQVQVDTVQDLGQVLDTTESVILKSPPIQIPPGTTSITPYLVAYARENSTTTTRFGAYFVKRLGALANP